MLTSRKAGPAACLVPVCLRLSLGVPLLVSSLERLQDVSAFVALWHALHLPGGKVVAPAYAVAESCGALLLLVGWQGRAVAGLFAIELLAEILLTKRPLTWFARWALEWQLFWVAVTLVWLGAGPLSLDGLLARRRARKYQMAAGALRTPP